MNTYVLLTVASILIPLAVVVIIVFPDRAGRRKWRK